LLFYFLFILFFNNLASEEKIYMQVIMDASGSMYQKVAEEHKIFTAKNIMRSFLVSNASIPEVNLSFRVYGNETGTCEDTKLLFGFEKINTSEIIGIVNSIEPKANAKTPLARSLELAKEDLKDKKGKRIIFLVTDGEETCDGDPCDIAKKLLKEFDIRIEVIGFDTSGADVEAQLGCIATDKPHFAKDKNDLNNAINDINNKLGIKNLKIISPDPNVNVSLYSVIGKTKKLLRTFLAGIDQSVPITKKNEKYEVIVNFEPKYAFNMFELEEDEIKTLKVSGKGDLLVESIASMIDFKVLDEKGFEKVPNLKVKEKLSLETGVYKLNYAYPPFVLQDNIEFIITPKGKKIIYTEKLGAIYVQTKIDEKIAYYIMDKDAKTEIGTYLTNTVGVLKVGTYKISILDKKDLIEVDITPNELSIISIE